MTAPLASAQDGTNSVVEAWGFEHTSGSADSSDTDSSTGTSTPKRCSQCSKPEYLLPDEAKLKLCSRCRTARYCSPDCQKADWSTHKPTCKKTGSTPNPPPPPVGMSSTGRMLDTMFGGSRLDQLSHRDCFARLIDSYRLRVEDDYTFKGELNGLYGGGDPLKGFQKFLNKAERLGTAFLPPWWCEEERRECERYAVDASEWSDLNCAVEKHDIQEHYGDPAMPMKLRLMAEKVYGKGVM